MDAYALHSPTVGRALALRALVGLTGAGAEERTGWVHIAYEGEWNGHPEGAFTLTREDFASCVRAFEAQSNPIRVDYNHASMMATAEPVPSAGYIQKLEIRDDGLWALVEFTKRCAQLIRDGEQRYCSGVFVFGGPDRKTGEEVPCELHSLAMTDTPYIDGQRPIVLSRTARLSNTTNGVDMEITREALMAELEKLEGDKFSADQLKALIEAVAKLAEAQDPKAGKSDKEEPEGEIADASATPLATEVPLAGDLSQADANTQHVAAADEAAPIADAGAMIGAKLAEATGMSPEALLEALSANLDAVVAALQGSGAAPMPMSATPIADTLVRELNDARAKLATYAKREAADEARALEAELDREIAAGKFAPAARDEMRSFALSNRPAFRALMGKLTPGAAVPVGREASAMKPEPGASQSLADAVIDESDPRVADTVRALNVAGVKDPAVRKRALARVIGSAG